METVVVIVAIAVLALLTLVGLLTRPGRRRLRRDVRPLDLDRSFTPDVRILRDPAPVVVPDQLVEPDSAPTPVLDRPAPVAGRLVRLRSRLARSQTSMGRGLLTLLSRDVLDEDTWEEVEDTLLSAD
ncbi:MAG: hypothetical protein ACR2J0_02995, partial [Mycobacteriales bacterium]